MKLLKKYMVDKYKTLLNAYMQYPHFQETFGMDFQKQTSNVGENVGSRF